MEKYKNFINNRWIDSESKETIDKPQKMIELNDLNIESNQD